MELLLDLEATVGIWFVLSVFGESLHLVFLQSHANEGSLKPSLSLSLSFMAFYC